MKKYLWIIISVSIIQVSQAQNNTINYFNQPPPGDTAQIFAPGVISLDNRSETKLVYSPNGQECLLKTSAGLLYTKQENGHWLNFKPADFIGNLVLGEPFFAPDGQKIFFVGHADIWASNRIKQTWTNPEKINSPISTEAAEWHPTVTLNGTLYFCSSRNRPKGGYGALDIFRSKYEYGHYTTVEKLDTIINSCYGAWDPFISPDESYIIFSSIHPDGYGKEDQYISFHNDNGTWTSPKNLGSSINTNKTEYGSYISPDKKYYFFSRSNGNSAHIYWVKADFIDSLRKANDTNK